MFGRLDNGTQTLHRLRAEMDRVLSDWMPTLSVDPPGWLDRGMGYPSINVWEDSRNLYAEAEMPGVRMEDIEVSVMGNELTLKGHRQPVEASDATVHRRERGCGAFSRVLRLPVDVNAAEVSAQLRDGVLTITLPKAPSALPRKIEVKSQS